MLPLMKYSLDSLGSGVQKEKKYWTLYNMIMIHLKVYGLRFLIKAGIPPSGDDVTLMGRLYMNIYIYMLVAKIRFPTEVCGWSFSGKIGYSDG